MTKNQIKKRIFKYIKAFQKLDRKEKKFIPGKSKVRYAGAFYDEKELIYMCDAMLEGWFGIGKLGRLLEEKLTKYIGSKSTVLVNSGSSASLVSMSTLINNLNPNKIPVASEVITPACTFATTVGAIVQTGLVPVFVDVSLGNYNVIPEMVAKAITKKTKVMFLPHTLGNPNQMDKIKQIAKQYKLLLVEDNCDALGSEYNGQKTGSFGSLATSSFYPAHHMTMAGEGGAVYINDLTLLKAVSTIRNWGRGCWCSDKNSGYLGACKQRFNFKLDGIPIDHKYLFLTLGYNLKPVEIQAAMGLAQMDKFDQMTKLRALNFKQLNNFFKKHEKYFILPESFPKAKPSWFAYPLTIREDTPFDRVGITQFLEENLIETRTLFAGNITRQPAMKGVNYKIAGKLTNSDKIMKDTFFIGTGPHITTTHVNYIQEIFTKFFKKI